MSSVPMPRDRTPSGYTRVEAYMGRGQVVVMGQPTDESHNCDEMGCGSTGSHVVARVPLPPASAGEVETARIVGWAMCFVPFGHDDTAAKPKLIFDSKEHAEDVARRQTAFGIGEGARFVVRPITWAAERAATSGDHPSAARRGHEGEARGGAS